MRFFTVFTALIIALSACGERGDIAYTAKPIGTDFLTVFLATQHDLGLGGDKQLRDRGNRLRKFGAPRTREMRYYSHTISVPTKRDVGTLNYAKQPWSPTRHFLFLPNAPDGSFALENGRIDSAVDFADQVYASQSGSREAVIFVHGYNTNAAEAAFRLAQITKDAKINAPVVAFAWPSAGQYRGYLYDRESMLFARDALEKLILILTDGGARKVTLLGHSMGSNLIMETLRQISLRGDDKIQNRIGAAVLFQPDLDADIFISQMTHLSPIASDILLVTSAKDSVLRFSSFIRGTTHRVGNMAFEDEKTISALGVEILDATPQTGNLFQQSGHFVGVTQGESLAKVIDSIKCIRFVPKDQRDAQDVCRYIRGSRKE